MAQQTGTFSDARDGKIYKTVKIGHQIWMAENLAFKAPFGCWSYASKERNVNLYGYLYNWNSALNACPDGWHLPSQSEWDELLNNQGGGSVASKNLKSNSGWSSNGNGNNTSGFSALPGGGWDAEEDAFKYLGKNCFWWSSTKMYTNDAYFISLDIEDQGEDGNSDRSNAASVRCVKN